MLLEPSRSSDIPPHNLWVWLLDIFPEFPLIFSKTPLGRGSREFSQMIPAGIQGFLQQDFGICINKSELSWHWLLCEMPQNNPCFWSTATISPGLMEFPWFSAPRKIPPSSQLPLKILYWGIFLPNGPSEEFFPRFSTSFAIENERKILSSGLWSPGRDWIEIQCPKSLFSLLFLAI